VTPGALINAIRQIPGINSATRWQKHGEDRLYLKFSVSQPGAETYIDLRCGVLFGFTGTWESDPHDLGERAIRAVRVLCGVFSRERMREARRAQGART
jgi:hypothetical protein